MSKNNRGLRFKNPRAVLAYEQYDTVYYKSMAKAMARYKIPSTSILRRLIEKGSTWWDEDQDGYTTFDWAQDDIPGNDSIANK
jgi:hypothetical protein